MTEIDGLASEMIAESRKFLVTGHYQPQPSERVAVCFGYRGTGIGRTGFGVSILCKLGYDVIYVAQAKKTSYQGLSASALADAVLPIAAGRAVLTYGASLGGYCALYYAGALNAEALAMSPQASSHPIYVNRKPDPKYPWRHLEKLEELPVSSYRPTIVYDPLVVRDASFVKKWALPAYPDAREIHVPRAGHEAAAKLAAAGKLKGLLSDFLTGAPIPQTIIFYDESSREGLRRVLLDQIETGNKESILQTMRALVQVETSTRELKRMWRLSVLHRDAQLKREVVEAILVHSRSDDRHAVSVLAEARKHNVHPA